MDELIRIKFPYLQNVLLNFFIILPLTLRADTSSMRYEQLGFNGKPRKNESGF